jgi:hypothetical protein
MLVCYLTYTLKLYIFHLGQFLSFSLWGGINHTYLIVDNIKSDFVCKSKCIYSTLNVKKSYKNNVEWCLLGCYAVWLL